MTYLCLSTYKGGGMNKIVDFLIHNFSVKAIIIILLTTISYAFLINNVNLWTDEMYSMLIAKDSFSDMWKLLLTEDSKPPLYYLYLRFILLFFPEKYEIFGAHFASYILLITAQIFSLTAIRKDYGDKVCFWMIVILLLHPISLWLAFEVRTYMLTSLLLLISLVYGLRLTREPKTIDFIKFGLISILSLYSHYYAGIWLMFLYSMILALYIHDKTFSKYIKPFFITALIVGISFFPWILVFLGSQEEISKYWYVNMSFVHFSARFFTNPLQPEILQSLFFIATVLGATSFSFVILLGCFNTEILSHRLKRLFLVSILSFIFSYLLLIVLSYTIRPMVTARYLKTYALIFYMAGAVVIATLPCIKKAISTALIIAFVFTYIDIRAISFDNQYQKLKNDINSYVSRDSVILTLDNANLFCEYYLPNHKCILAVNNYGEILRKNTLINNINLYHQEINEDMYVISIYNKVSDDCIVYNSSYRVGNGIHLCKLKSDTAKQLIKDSLDLRLNKYINS